MQNNQESRLGLLYRRVYDWLCGKHPHLRPWHFQWLGTIYLRRTLKTTLPHFVGRVLDVGCGQKPYRVLFTQATEYIGIDVAAGADYVVSPHAKFPFEDEAFDVVFATQVVEHVENLPHTLGEMSRVCKSGGVIVLSFPFLYNEHGAPYDFQRFTIYGAGRLFPYEILMVDRQGGFGSTIIILLLNWIEGTLNLSRLTRIFKGLMLPLWMPFCLVMNVLGLLLDRIDRTGSFYNNVFVVFRKT